MFKKIWSDPVWSKVIANGIIVIIGFIIALVYTSTTNMTPIQSITYVWDYKIKAGHAFLGIIIISAIQILTPFLFSKEKFNKKASKEKVFCDKWYKLIDNQNGLIYRFNTYISSYTHYPFISDLTVYCNKHNGQEPKMDKFRGCLDYNCVSANLRFDEKAIKDSIESQILVEWEKLNGKY